VVQKSKRVANDVNKSYQNQLYAEHSPIAMYYYSAMNNDVEVSWFHVWLGVRESDECGISLIKRMHGY